MEFFTLVPNQTTNNYDPKRITIRKRAYDSATFCFSSNGNIRKYGLQHEEKS